MPVALTAYLPALAAVVGLTLTSPSSSPVAGYWTLGGGAGDSPVSMRVDSVAAAPCQGDTFELRQFASAFGESGRADTVLLLPRKLTIAPSRHGVTIVDNCGHARAFSASGKTEAVQYGPFAAQTITRWADGQLVQEIATGPSTTIRLQFAGVGDALVVTETTRTSSFASKTLVYRYDSDAVR